MDLVRLLSAIHQNPLLKSIEDCAPRSIPEQEAQEQDLVLSKPSLHRQFVPELQRCPD
jgi:hypothetical protein